MQIRRLGSAYEAIFPILCRLYLRCGFFDELRITKLVTFAECNR